MPLSARLGAVAAIAIVLGTACGASTKPSSKATTTTATPSTTTGHPTSTTAAQAAFPYQPVFPFGSPEEAVSWQQAYRSGGQQPWHLDPKETALAFTRFLGYGENDRVVSDHRDDKGAHVGVGAQAENGNLSTAAIVHLVRYGTGNDAPWEVVGTDDTDFSLTAPAYGAVVTSPVHAGGRITGVDESITVHVQQLHANGLLGQVCCIPAGGSDSPWSATVAFSHPTDPVIVVSASTGGHLRNVERFTVTAARAG